MSPEQIDWEDPDSARAGTLARPALRSRLNAAVDRGQLTPVRSFCFEPLRPWIWTTGGACSLRTCWR